MKKKQNKQLTHDIDLGEREWDILTDISMSLLS